MSKLDKEASMKTVGCPSRLNHPATPRHIPCGAPPRHRLLAGGPRPSLLWRRDFFFVFCFIVGLVQKIIRNNNQVCKSKIGNYSEVFVIIDG